MYADWRMPASFLDRMDANFFAPEYVAIDDRLDKCGLAEPFGTHLSRVFKGAFYVLATEYADNGVPFIRVADITSGEVNLSKAVYLPTSVHKRERKTAVAPGDLLFAKGGSIGNSAVVPERILEANISQDVIGARVKPTIDAYFAQAFLSTATGVAQMMRWAQGNVHPHITNDAIRAVRIPIAESSLQRALGNKVRKAERLRELATASRDLAERQINAAYGSLPNENGFPQYGWHAEANIKTLRIDPWFHRPFYVAMAERLGGVDGLKPVGSVCQLVTMSAKLGTWKQQTFDYFEIGGVNSAVGEATAISTAVSDAPSRAKYLVRAGDVLVSTVRPNLKAVGQIDPDRSSPGVATSGFCVLRPPTPELGAYVRACLVHDAGVHQLMRWNTGGTYPAIDHDVPGRVLIPFDQEGATEVGGRLLEALRHNREATCLMQQARAAVDALIDGTLDEPALLAEGDAIEQWLAENPGPHPTEKP